MIASLLFSVLTFSVLLMPVPAFAEGDRCILQQRTITNPDGTEVIEKKMEASSNCKTAFDNKETKPFFFKTADCYCCGTCGLNDIVGTVIQVSRFIFGTAGSLALLMIMYGGFQWLTAAGSSERVKKGTETLTHAAIGLAIIFGAWIFINFLLIAITGETVKGTGIANLMNGEWFKVE